MSEQMVRLHNVRFGESRVVPWGSRLFGVGGPVRIGEEALSGAALRAGQRTGLTCEDQSSAMVRDGRLDHA